MPDRIWTWNHTPTITHLEEAVNNGSVKMEVIDDAVRRILQVKFELGLFDNPYRYCNKERESSLIYHKDHMDAVLDMAKKSIVLLKNKNRLLPLDREQKKIALIGPLANDKNSPLGSWRIGSDDNSSISVLEGLKAFASKITYAKGADLVIGETNFIQEVKINDIDTSGFSEAIELARHSDVVIMALGEHGFQSGEGRSRTDLGLPGVQQELLEAVYKVNSNIILLLMNGRPLVIPWADQNIPAILECWQLGTQSGHAIAEVVFGQHNPSGKLPMTFPRDVGQIPIYYNYFNTGRPGPKAEVFWAHYGDLSNKPLYPFGYGLSYTTFEYSDLKIDVSDQNSINVSVKIKNTGDRSGTEFAQLYIHDPVAHFVHPIKELRGFQKVILEAQETKIIEFSLKSSELGYYTDQGEFIVEPGIFRVAVGTNSDTNDWKEFVLE